VKVGPPTDSASAALGEPQVCEQCHTVSRLTNGLCLNCLLHGALDKDETPSGKEAFREVLAGVRSGAGDWRIAEHEILDEIARGGMGVVYRAREPHSDRIVALKCVLAYQGGDSDHHVARFRREAETVSRLEHPNIVPIYQVGETADGFPYFTMKFASAGSLLQARQTLRNDPRRSASLMVKVARAIHFAHEHGVLHRDLKPGNILLDGHGEPLVSDFGLARCETVSGSLTQSLASLGTPGYIAPEQADGPSARLTPAADVYSLGAVLFDLLAGRTPFVGENAFAVMKQAAQTDAPKLRSVVPKADRDLEIICARCLEREPADRYQTAAEVANDLQSWLEDRPIAASAPGVVLRTRRWVRRNRMLAASIAALGILVIGSVLWQVRTQKRETMMTESVLTARSVVVLPFLDLDKAAGDPEVTQWVADSLRSQLDSLGPARVVLGSAPSWSRVDEVRRAAEASKGRTILTGTVRNVKGQRRISLRLLSLAADQALLRAAITQTDTASRSAGNAQKWVLDIHKGLNTDSWANVGPIDPVLRSEKAAQAMTAGRNLMQSYTVSDYDRAIALFREAVALVPDSAQAHSYLARAVIMRTHYMADFSFLEDGKAEALKALQLDPDSVEAHQALAGVYFQEGKFQEALEEQMRTIEMGGVESGIAGFAAQTLNVVGRPDRAVRWLAIAARLHGTPGTLEPGIGDCWTQLGDDDQAFAAYNHASRLKPGSSQGALGRAHLHMLRGEFDAARELCRDRLQSYDPGEMAQIAAQIEFFDRKWVAAEELYVRLAKADPDGGGSFYGAVSFQSALGRIKQESGQDENARTLLQAALVKETATLATQPYNPELAYRVAAIEASLNSIEPSLQHLRQAISLGWLDYRSLQKDPRFDAVRNHPEFDALMDGLSAKVAELKNNAQREDKK
jgi:tetratricopeptide (TPR) repeat protein/tRNA A-37 threonylcarbamoyl transferase component Bud32